MHEHINFRFNIKNLNQILIKDDAVMTGFKFKVNNSDTKYAPPTKLCQI